MREDRGKKIASRIYIIRSRLNERGRETETPSKFPLRSLPPPTVFHGGGIPLLFPLPSTSSPSPSPPPPSRRRKAENKRRPFISGAYIIRFFTRPASPRMTNWNNNNGYILHGGPRHRGPRLKYIYCRCPRHNRILSDKKRTDPTALPYLSS